MPNQRFDPIQAEEAPLMNQEAEERLATVRKKGKFEYIFTGVIFFIAAVLFIIYFSGQLREYNRAGTATSVSISSEQDLDFPAITICNLEAGVPLTFTKCTKPDGLKCRGVPRNDLNNSFGCVTFNADYTDVLITQNSGLEGLLTIEFFLNIQLYPKTAGLFGAQVVLHEPGTLPNIAKSGFFVAPAKATIVSIYKTVTERLNGTTSNNWEGTPSTLAIDDTIATAYDLVVLGIMYRELTTTRITEIRAYSTGQLLGSLSGIASGLFQAAKGLMIAMGLYFALRLQHRKQHSRTLDLANVATTMLFNPGAAAQRNEQSEEIHNFVQTAQDNDDTTDVSTPRRPVVLPTGLRKAVSRAKDRASNKDDSSLPPDSPVLMNRVSEDDLNSIMVGTPPDDGSGGAGGHSARPTSATLQSIPELVPSQTPQGDTGNPGPSGQAGAHHHDHTALHDGPPPPPKKRLSRPPSGHS